MNQKQIPLISLAILIVKLLIYLLYNMYIAYKMRK